MPVEEIAEGMRKCPFCAEIIRAEAKICRFCQRDLPLEPTEDGTAATEPREFRYGDRVLSPTLGEGAVVGSPEATVATVRVSLDRLRRIETLPKSELSLISPSTHAAGPAAPSAVRSEPDETLIVAAWLSAFLFPLVGFICGVILAAKGQVGHGVGSMVVSFLMSAVWLAIFGAMSG